MGAFLSCFSRPKPCRTQLSQTTAISHPYPLASRQRAMSEYHPSPHHSSTLPHPRHIPRSTHSPTTHTSHRIPSPSTSSRPIPHHAPSSRTRSTSMASSSHSYPHRSSHMPIRVHEIPFPLLSHHTALQGSTSSSGPSSGHGSPVRQSKDLSIGSAAALVPDSGTVPGQRMGMGGTERRRLKKVQLVERDWELWRAEDWVGYGDVNATGVRTGLEALDGRVDQTRG